MRTRWWMAAASVVLVSSGTVAGQAAPEPAETNPVTGPEANPDVRRESWPPGYEWFRSEGRPIYRSFEEALLEKVSSSSLRGLHDKTASFEHVAGTDGDQRQIEVLDGLLSSWGYTTEVHRFWTYLPAFEDASVEIVSPVSESLTLSERAADAWSEHATPGWNSYSGSGDATGEVVYANYGTLEDFETLKRLGVDCTDKVVLARYGRNYRGFKAKYAQEAGASALLIYTDPADSGYMRGIEYPEGGYANDSYIQRGSVKTLPYPGDPLTPGIEATEDAERLDPSEVALPKIPVQPIGYGAAEKVLSRMRGDAVPSGWQGGLPFTYRLTGDVRVRVRVSQERAVRESANVIAWVEGSVDPTSFVVIGSHHDAWGHGAADPLAGTICLLETARCLASMVEEGFRPARTVVFACWGAEEHGIIGSTEWVERDVRRIREHCVAYVNLDMSAMGPNFRASASPELRRLIRDAAGVVPQPGDPERSVLEAWSSRGPTSIGDLGGGSDHLPFVGLAGVPSCSLGGGGAQGVAYHSAYDNLAWYRKVVGEDYGPAVMVTRMTAVVVSRLANATVLPLDLAAWGPAVRGHLGSLSSRGRAAGVFEDGEGVASELELIESMATRFESMERTYMERTLDRIDALQPEEMAAINARTMASRAAWLDWRTPITADDWHKNMYVRPDPTSGYSAWMLPGLREAIESGGEGLEARVRSYEGLFLQLFGLRPLE